MGTGTTPASGKGCADRDRPGPAFSAAREKIPAPANRAGSAHRGSQTDSVILAATWQDSRVCVPTLQRETMRHTGPLTCCGSRARRWSSGDSQPSHRDNALLGHSNDGLEGVSPRLPGAAGPPALSQYLRAFRTRQGGTRNI